MIKNKISVFIAIIILTISLFITYFTFDSSLRRYAYTKSIGVYKLYQTHIISGHIYYRDFSRASKQILKYIEFTQKISKGKNSMLQEIVDVTELVTSKIYTQDEFNEMERVYVKINEITDDIYKNHVWLARSLSDDNPGQSIKHLNQALRLSKSSEEAYREIIRIFANKHQIKTLLENYCKDYFKEFAGAAVGRISTAQNENNFFQGNNSNFAISINGNYNKLYLKFINNLNNYERYEFIFENEENIKRFEILKNFFYGTKISIKNIEILNDEINKLNLNDIIIYSIGSYILDQNNNEVIFLSGSLEDDILKFNLKREYRNVKKISVELKIEKLPLSNKSICLNLNEN